MEQLGFILSQPFVWVVIVVGIVGSIWWQHTYNNASPQQQREMDKQLTKAHAEARRRDEERRRRDQFQRSQYRRR